MEILDARNIGDALAQLTVSEEKNPEKRMRAAFTAFQEERLPQLRKENPELKLSQVKEMLWKEWQKSPSNPFNQ